MYKDGLPIQIDDEKRDDSHKIYQAVKRKQIPETGTPSTILTILDRSCYDTQHIFDRKDEGGQITKAV